MAYLISKIVFAGFIAAWFFADSPIKRSSSVKETKDGVVKLPCSFATRQTLDLPQAIDVVNVLISTFVPS